MRIDFASLAFGYKVKIGGATPNWATSLGQGKEYKINKDPEIDELLKGLVYSSVSLAKVTSKIGKGGRVVSGNADDSPIIVASLFKKVYVNETLIDNGAYVVLVTRDTSQSHEGRLRFKYGPSNTNSSGDSAYSNEKFWKQVKQQLNLEEKACFFVYDISVKNQNELFLKTIVVNKNSEVEYADSTALHVAWDNLIDEDEQKNEKENSQQLEFLDLNEEGIEENKTLHSCLEVKRNPRNIKNHPLNCIVYGAPGTGKTYSMVEYALAIAQNKKLDEFRKINTDRSANIKNYKELVKNGQVVFTTFHQNYGYEQFIQGLRPDTDSDALSFKVVDGVFKIISEKALNDADSKNYIIIIDEINRANISKVFGELITLIEEDKRWGELNEMSATLQSGDIFAVPNNLYIIGTMNSADKSISLIDAALRRRFDFIEQKPDATLISDPMLSSFLKELNKCLVKDLESTDLLVGHSYFMKKKESDLCDILNNNIIPLLYEYHYDVRKKVYSTLKTVIKETGAKIEIVDDVEAEFGRLRVKGV